MRASQSRASWKPRSQYGGGRFDLEAQVCRASYGFYVKIGGISQLTPSHRLVTFRSEDAAEKWARKRIAQLAEASGDGGSAS